MIVRAGSYDRTMVRALGINVTPIFSLVFGLGAALAAFAGVLAAPILSVSPGMGDKIIIIAFVVVVIGLLGVDSRAKTANHRAMTDEAMRRGRTSGASGQK